MKKSSSIILVAVLLSVAASYVMTRIAPPPAGDSVHKETSFERVQRTGTLRCGYEYWDSGVMRDPTTGAMRGTWVDLLDELGKAAHLKIEWTEHVGWGDVGAALKSGKIDAACAGMWQSTEKAMEMAFSTPLAYQSIEAFARAGDSRFDNNIDRINSGDVTILVIDSDNSDFLAQQDFPKAKRLALGQLNGTDAELLLGLSVNKADVAFTLPGLWQSFDKANPGKVKRVAPGHNLRVFGLSIAVDNDDFRLLQLINTGVDEITNSGAIDRILKKYDAQYPDMYLKTVKPYAE